jgi:hypothetical protein
VCGSSNGAGSCTISQRAKPPPPPHHVPTAGAAHVGASQPAP